MTTKGYHLVEGEYHPDEPPVIGKSVTIEALKHVPEGTIIVYHAHADDALLESFRAARHHPEHLITDRRGRNIGKLLASSHEDPDNHVLEDKRHAIAFNFVIETHLDISSATVKRGNIPGSRYAKKSQPSPQWLLEHPASQKIARKIKNYKS